MSEYGDLCKEIRRHNQEKRWEEFSKNSDKLEGLMYEHEVKNNGHHIVIRNNGLVVDYWPSSDKYHLRGSGKYLHGFNDMMAVLSGLKKVDK